MYYLRKIEPNQDCNQLFEFVNNQYHISGLFPYRSRFMNKDEYQHWLLDQLGGYFHDFYVVEERDDVDIMKIRGYMFAYDYRIYDNHCKVFGYMGYGIDSKVLGQFVDILFKEYPLNKVFLETTEVDNKLLHAAYDVGFTQEAMLTNNRFINGRYHALFVLSLYPQNRRRII